MSGIGGSSVKALTRSTVPGNHLLFDAGVAGGLHCGGDRTFVLLQYAIDGNLGVEQMQDLAHQQGNRDYDPKAGNGLLFYGAHGPLALLVHNSRYVHAALSGTFWTSLGKGRWGGKRWSVDADLALAFGEQVAYGFGPWYRFQHIDYGPASKVEAPNVRRSHTFGLSLVIALGPPLIGSRRTPPR